MSFGLGYAAIASEVEEAALGGTVIDAIEVYANQVV